ncbi:MAG: transporter, partial [Gemmatimonadetes bacterium]
MTHTTEGGSRAGRRHLRPFGFAVLLLPLTLALAPVSVRAQEEECDEGHHHHIHFSHPIFTESVSPDDKVRLDWAGTFAEDEDEHEIEFEGEYTFADWFSIEVAAPYAFVSETGEETENAFGNLEVALKFANYAFEDRGVLLGYGVEFGLPTGDPDKGIGDDHIVEIEPFFNIGIKTGDLELVGWTRFGIPTNQDEGEEVETEFHYDAAALYHFNRRLQGLLELNGDVGLSGEEAGEGTVSLGPGVKFAPFFDNAFMVGIGASFPLDDSEVDAALRVSL